VNPAEMLRRGFDGAVVLVVGGHGDIGSAVCRQATELGAHVVAASRRGGAGAGPPAPGTAVSVVIDITDLSSVTSALRMVEEWFGRIDVLVNAAGITHSVPAHDLHLLTDELIGEVFASNAMAPIRLLRESLPLLRQGTDAVVVQVSSVAARMGQGSNIAYVGAKAALDAMTAAWARSLAPVRFVCVAPSALSNTFVPGRPPEFFERTVAATPLGRLATADEVAAAVLVAARAMPMTTGVTIAVDGGRHL
jgi:3-oxoacyl-[acyl-carrier protein] reductase